MDDYNRVMAERPAFYTDFPHSENNRIRASMRVAARIYRKVFR